MKKPHFPMLILLLLIGCAGPVQEPPPGNPPEEIRTLESKGYDFQWEADHWESRNMMRGSVFFYYPYGFGELDPGFGYSASIDLDETAINVARRDFFFAFDVDVETQLWMLQIAQSILTDGETDGRSCRGNLCCNFLYDYPGYRFYCMPN